MSSAPIAATGIRPPVAGSCALPLGEDLRTFSEAWKKTAGYRQLEQIRKSPGFRRTMAMFEKRDR